MHLTGPDVTHLTLWFGHIESLVQDWGGVKANQQMETRHQRNQMSWHGEQNGEVDIAGEREDGSGYEKHSGGGGGILSISSGTE